jgi:hypothetical protein
MFIPQRMVRIGFGPSPYIELEEFAKLEQLAVWEPNHL